MVAFVEVVGEVLHQLVLVPIRVREVDACFRRRLDEFPIRTEEGYMADIKRDDGALLLVENHNPVCEAATECQGLCAKRA